MEELEAYAESCRGLDSAIASRRAPYEEALSLLRDAYIYISYAIDKCADWKRIDDSEAVGILTARIGQSLLGIHQCLSAGCLADAQCVLRSMLEALSFLANILQDPTPEETQRRCRLYLDYEWLERRRHQNWRLGAEKRGTFEAGPITEPSERGRIDEKCAQIEKNYPNKSHWASGLVFKKGDKKCGKKKNPKPNMEEMLRAVGLEALYLSYKTDCWAVHNSPMMHTLFIQDKETTMAPNFDPLLISIVGMAVGYAAETVAALSRSVLGRNDKIQYLEEVCGRLFDRSGRIRREIGA